ncbi:ABC-2 family transporter protein [Marinitoga lauensis]|uniref:ABC-2 family transporter protein n=1 Tax=Marinitoga lauensis TaxID=2201189 RepID=UPI0010108D8F|nr:ABC-2 family transporter protein [Marinitoga lauensis]
MEYLEYSRLLMKKLKAYKLNWYLYIFQNIINFFFLYLFLQSGIGEKDRIIRYYFSLSFFLSHIIPVIKPGFFNLIRNGEFDNLILMPINKILYFSIVEIVYPLYNIFLTLPFIFIFSIIFNIPLKNLVVLLVIFPFSLILSSLISILFSLSAFWLKKGDSLSFWSYSLFRIISGGIIPIKFFPNKIKMVLEFLPFNYIVNFPGEAFANGVIDIGNFLKLLFWILIIFIISNMVYNYAISKYETAGG